MLLKIGRPKIQIVSELYEKKSKEPVQLVIEEFKKVMEHLLHFLTVMIGCFEIVSCCSTKKFRATNPLFWLVLGLMKYPPMEKILFPRITNLRFLVGGQYFLKIIDLAHDDKLWVMAPGLEFVHPRGASLNDFELLEVLIPISVSSPYDVLSLLVC